MSSESDDAIRSDLSSENEDMIQESDEELLNSDSPVEEKETVPMKKHRKSYDPRFAAPSFEERQMMRDADMKVEISMLEMEVQQYIDNLNVEHACTNKVNEFLKTINEFLSHLPEKDISSSGASLYQHFVNNTKTETKLRFIKPTAVYIIGSFIQKNRSSFPMTIDMTVQIPDQCFSERDIINWKYFNKRALYLQFIALSLHKKYPKLTLKYEWMHGDYDKPALLVTVPKDVCRCGTILRILPVPSETIFSVQRLAVARNNVHVTTDTSSMPSTWFYNSSILEDMLLNHYTQFVLEQAHQVPNLLPTSHLIRKWLVTANLDSHVNGFIMTLLLAILVQQGRITEIMSVWQCFMVMLDSLSKLDVSVPLHFRSKDGMNTPYENINTSIFQLVDDSFGYIVSYRVTQTMMMEVKRRAMHQCEMIRSVYDPTVILDLFGQPKALPLQYDVIVKLTIADLEKENMYVKKNEELNYPQYIAAQRDIEEWAIRGLMNRAVIVRSQYLNNITWSLTEDYSKPHYLLLCLTLNPDNISRFADRGPQARTPEVDSWLALWGNKSELRRYKDGSIQYTNIWSCQPGQNYMVPVEILRHVLSLHTLAVTELNVLYQSFAQFIPPIMDTKLTETCTQLCNVIRNHINEYDHNSGIDLGAHISTVEPISYDIHGCSLVSTRPSPYLNSSLPTSGHKQYSVIKPIELALRIQGGTGLPSDVTVLDKVKTIWATTISSRLEKHGYECHVAETWIDVYTEGYCFRCLPYTDREVEMARKMMRANTLPHDDYQKRFLQFEFLPSHQETLKNAVLQNPAFLPTLRLVKYWFASHMFTNSIPEALLDELVLEVFTKQNPLHPVKAFLCFLSILATFPWSESTLCVNTNLVLTPSNVEEMVKAVETERQESTQKWACCVVSPRDPQSILTRMIQPAVWSRLVATAQTTLKQALKTWWEDGDYHCFFTPSLHDFDLILKLREEYLTPLPKWIRLINGKMSTRGAAYVCKEYKNVMMDRNKFLVGYRPERVILEAVKEIVGNGGVVMMNTIWGKKIGIAWNPGYFLPGKMSMASVSHCFPVQKGTGDTKDDVMLVRDIFDLIQDLKESLGDVCEEIEFH